MQNRSLAAAAIFAAIGLTSFAGFATSVQAQLIVTHVAKQPNRPNPSPTTYGCETELGYLRRVHAEELAGITSHKRVWVTPVCVGEDYVFRNDGNVGTLRTRIAENTALRRALSASNFGPDDVIGIRMMGPNTVTLYVFPFHR